MATIQSVEASIKIADNWQQKGEPTWVSKCVSSALMGYLQIALTEHAIPASGIAWLASRGVAALLERHLDTLQTLAADVQAGKRPGSVIAGNYPPLVFAHFAWCLDQRELGDAFVTFARNPHVNDLNTRFWQEYARGLVAVVSGVPYHPAETGLRGEEKYWAAYLPLFEAVSNSQDPQTAVAEIERLFPIRNSDRKITDAHQIEGSAHGPVKWNFRLTGLLRRLQG
ncbi:MAG TPA: hypothetical protein VGM54_12800 [Chthoniobacter sp.]|jgi:hypothetical protein